MTGILAGLIGSFKKAALTWTTGTVTNRSYRDAVYANLANGKYFVVGQDNGGINTTSYIYSTNGTSWSTGTLPVSTTWNAIGSNGSRIIALRNSSSTAYYSDNGTTWTATATLPASVTPRQIIWDGTNFVIPAGSSRAIYYSTNGTGSWSTTGTSIGITTGSAQGIGYDSVSRYVVTSTTSTTEAGTTTAFPSSWSLITMPSTGIWLSAVYGNSIWVVARAGSSSYATSTNGTTWTSRTLPSNFSEATADIYAKMIFSDGKFYYYYVNNVYSSTDGINWTTEATVTGGALDNGNGWAVGEGKILVFGYDATTTGSDTYLIGQ